MRIDPALDMGVAGGLAVMGAVAMLYFAVQRRDRAPLWLGVFNLALSTHFAMAGQAVAGALALAALPLFIRAMYPKDCPTWGARAIAAFGLAVAAAAVLQLDTSLLIPIRGITVAAAAWLIWVLARAAMRRGKAWPLLLAGMPLLLPVFILDAIPAGGLGYALVPLGFLAFIAAPVVLLTRRFTRALDDGMLRSAEDRTRISRLDRELRNQTKYTEDVLDSVPLALALRDADGKYLFVNQQWEDWFGPRDRTIGSTVRERMSKEKAEEVLALDRAALERGAGAAPSMAEIALNDRIYTQTRSVMTDAEGNIVGLLVATLDTTERQLQEQKLRDQVALTRAVIDENPNAISVKDREGRYVTVNDAWIRMIGMPRERVIGRTIRDLFSTEEAERHHAADMRLIEKRRGSAELETLRTGPDGNPQWLIVRKAVLRDGDGNVSGIIGTNTDVTALKQTERALADRNKFITELIEALPVSVVIRDTESRHVQVNRTWEKYYGLRREDVIGKRFMELEGWKDDPELAEFAESGDALDRATLARGADHPLEPMERRRKGRVYLNTRRALVDSEGKPVGIVGVSLDITEQKATAEELAIEQRRLALVVRANDVGIVDWDGHTHATYYSPRFRQILGHAPDADTSGWPDYFKVLIHPEDRERVASRWRAFIAGSGPEGRHGEYYAPDEYRLLRADASYVWVQVSGVAVRDAAGFVTRWIAAISDITERREQAQELERRGLALAEQKAILETTLENIDQGITMIDKDLRIMAFNWRFLELLDFPADVFAHGRPSLEQAFRYNAKRGEYGPGDPDEQVRTRMELARKFEPHYFERKRPNGTVLAIRGQPLPSGAGFVTTYTDITEQKRAEEELRATMRLREEVERMSRHDLKTPINSVIAVSRMLRENARLGPDDTQLLVTVERAGYRILEMVNLSLDLFRMEQRTYEFRPQVVDLDEVAAKVATDLQSQAASKNVFVKVADRGLASARAEELLCYSMLANLVKNAIEAAPEGTEVSIELGSEDKWVFVRVHNAGAVPEAVRGRFFQKYTTAGKSAGVGLGTYSAQLLARAQGGELTLETSEDSGTTLTVRLRAAEASDLKSRRESAPKPVDLPVAPLDLPPMRVLLADDDEFNRLVLKRLLPPPLRVSLAVNGRAALDAALAEWPDVVLLDLEMPVMDGYEAARRLREAERELNRKRLTIVAISSNDEEAIIQRALAAGCDQYLMKPASREILWQILSGVSVPLASGGPGPTEPKASDEVLLDPDLEQTLPGFLESRREALAEMPRALAAADRAAFKRLAHRLAGSFALYGFKWAAAQARAIERLAPDAEDSELAERTAALRAHLDSVRVRVARKDAVTP